MELSHHAIDKLETYGIEGPRFQGWCTALERGEAFLDASTGAAGLVIRWEGRSPLGGDFEQQWEQGRHDLPNR